jgi:hypothetical protein
VAIVDSKHSHAHPAHRANSNFTAVKSRLLRGEGTAQLYNCKVFAATQGDCHRAE